MKQQWTWILCGLVVFATGCTKTDPKPEAPAGQVTVGGEWNESAGDVLELSDNTLLVVGGTQSSSTDGYDLAIWHLDADGKVLSEEIRGEEGRDEMGWRVLRYSTGEFAVFGTRRNFEGGTNYAVVTILNDQLQIVSQVESALSIPGTGLVPSGAQMYELPNATGFVVCFSTNVNPYVMRFDANGALMNVQSFPEFAGVQGAQAFCRAADSSFVLFTTSKDYNSSYYDQLHALKFDPFGNFQSSQLIGLANDVRIRVQSATTKRNGDFVVGFMELGYNSENVCIVSRDLFTTSFERVNNISPMFCTITELQDGRYFLGGYDQFSNFYYGYSGPSNMRRLVTDSVGLSANAGSYGGDAEDQLSRVVQRADGRVLMLGVTQSYGNGGTDLYICHYSN